MSKKATDQDTDILVEDDVSTKEPPMYRVLLLNDDYTTMEFVVLILETVFHRSHAESEAIMYAVHNSGKGTAGIYSREVAETKIAIVHQLAKENQFPLRCEMEPQ